MQRARIIGYDRKGRPIREIRGASQPLVEGGTGADPGGGDPGGLDDDLLNGGTDDPPGGDPQGQQQQQGGDQPPAWWASASASMKQEMTAEIDRRINSTRRSPNRQQQQQTPPAAPAGSQQIPQGPSREDIREARTVFREVLADTGLKLSAEERDLVGMLTSTAVGRELEHNPDPDVAGAAAARQVAEQIKKVRKGHQDSLIRTLKQRGALNEEKLKPGQQNTAPAAGPGKDWQTGVSTAADMAAKRGMVIPGANTQQQS